MIIIVPGDTVYHEPSGLYYRCDNKKQAKWMTESSWYKKVLTDLPESYSKKNFKGVHVQEGEAPLQGT